MAGRGSASTPNVYISSAPLPNTSMGRYPPAQPMPGAPNEPGYAGRPRGIVPMETAYNVSQSGQGQGDIQRDQVPMEMGSFVQRSPQGEFMSRAGAAGPTLGALRIPKLEQTENNATSTGGVPPGSQTSQPQSSAPGGMQQAVVQPQVPPESLSPYALCKLGRELTQELLMQRITEFSNTNRQLLHTIPPFPKTVLTNPEQIILARKKSSEFIVKLMEKLRDVYNAVIAAKRNLPQELLNSENMESLGLPECRPEITQIVEEAKASRTYAETIQEHERLRQELIQTQAKLKDIAHFLRTFSLELGMMTSKTVD